MTTTTAHTATFRKTKTGEWVAFGPAELIKPGHLNVTLKNGGTKEVIVKRVGKTFNVNGVEYVYGYLAADRPSNNHRQNCCWHPCPVTGIKCTPNTPCHDCA